MSSTAHKLTQDQRVKAKEIIAKVILRKGTQAKAAEEIERVLGAEISQEQVSYYVKILRREWVANTQKDISIIKAEEVAELDALKGEVYEQWERSKLNAETITTKLVGVDEVKSNKAKPFLDDETEDPRDSKLQVQTEETKKSAGQSGDPRYVHNIIEISQQKAKLLGLNAPEKIEISWEEELIINNIPQEKIDKVRQATDEYNKQIAAILAGTTGENNSKQ